MIITIKIRTEPRRGSMGLVRAADHAEIIISNLKVYLQDRYPRTEIAGVEWDES